MRVTEDTISRLLKNKALVKEFKFLQKQKPRRGCGGCGARRTKTVIDTNQIRRRLTKLPNKRLQKIKDALNAPKLSVRYRNKRGEIVDKII